MDAAGTIDNLEINRHTRTDFELVTNPKPPARRIRFAADDGAVDPGFQSCAINGRKTLILPNGCDAQHQPDSNG
jgi:hypothetical protein